MRVTVFSARPYDRHFLEAANGGRHELRYIEATLGADTAALASNCDAVCAFVNDDLSAATLQELAVRGVRGVALRSAGFNNADVAAASAAGILLARVPAYSPHAVAEHTVALMLTLNRQTHRAWNRVREGNFSIDGLLGFDMAGKTAAIIGTGKVGEAVARILSGFGCRLLAVDMHPRASVTRLGARYVSLDEALPEADIVTLHCPLTPNTRHLIDSHAIDRMRLGAMLINTSRGAVVDTAALVRGIKDGRLGYVGMDVYEEEDALFFEDRSATVLQDDVLARLMTFHNVLITAHQGFFTREAMQHIAETTLDNLDGIEQGVLPAANALVPQP